MVLMARGDNAIPGGEGMGNILLSGVVLLTIVLTAGGFEGEAAVLATLELGLLVAIAAFPDEEQDAEPDDAAMFDLCSCFRILAPLAFSCWLFFSCIRRRSCEWIGGTSRLAMRGCRRRVPIHRISRDTQQAHTHKYKRTRMYNKHADSLRSAMLAHMVSPGVMGRGREWGT